MFQCVTLEGWTEILYWVSCSSPPPSHHHHHQHLLSTKAPFELRISLFFFCLFLFLFFVLFLCPEPCVWWLGAGHQRLGLAVDLLLLSRPPRRLLHHEPHPRDTLWVRSSQASLTVRSRKDFQLALWRDCSSNIFWHLLLPLTK